MSISTNGTLIPTSKKNTKLKEKKYNTDISEYEKTLDFDFLTQNDVIGCYALNIFENQLFVSAKPTDFSKLLGTNSAGIYWLKNYFYDSVMKSDRIACSPTPDFNDYTSVFCKAIGARPSFKYSTIKEEEHKKEVISDKVMRIEYGEYPQDVVSKEIAKKLEEEYKSSNLEFTGKVYRFLSKEDGYSFAKKIEFKEYMYYGKKYIRAISAKNEANRNFSNSLTIFPNEAYWIEVSPITWLVDLENDISLAEKILFGGIIFHTDDIYKGNFKKTFIKKFMDTYFSKDIIPSKNKNLNEVLENHKSLPKNNEIEANETMEEKLVKDIKEQLGKIKNSDYVQEISLKVNNLLDEYNNKISNLDNSKILLTSTETISGLRRVLLTNLSTILDEVTIMANYIKKYSEFILELDDLLKIMKQEKVECNTDLKMDFNIISNFSLPFIEEEKSVLLRNKVISLLKEMKIVLNEAIVFILENKKDLEMYKNKNEFELSLRKSLHPILEEINDSVIKHDIARQILEGTNLIIKEAYQKNKTTIINNYINIMNDLYNDILNKSISNKFFLKVEEINNLKAIIKTEIDFSKDINDILKQLTDIIKNLCKFQYDLDDRIKQKREISKSYIKVRL